MTPTLEDRIKGTIVGTLIGDALGVGPHWYYDLDELRREHGNWISDYRAPKPGRYHAGLTAGESSQTGQVYRLLLESVATRGAYDEDDFTAKVDVLLASLDGTPQGGRYTDQAMRDVWHARKLGIDWERAGSFADTAEASTRTPILAALHANDFAAALRDITRNVRLTHRDPFIMGQSLAFGLIVHGLVNGLSLTDVSQWIRDKAQETGQELAVPIGPEVERTPKAAMVGCTDAVLQPGWSAAAAKDPAIRIDPPQTACRLFGLACTQGFMLPAAYYFTARFDGDFELSVLSALNGGGNNMARASLTGALAGAMRGLGGIPERFIKGLADHDQVLEQTEKIAAAAGGGNPL